MCNFVSLLSLCAVLVGQSPFAACPAAVVTDAAAPAPAQAPAADAPSPHHHAAAPTAVAGDSDLTVPAPARHGGSCTMLTRCQWAAVPAEPAAADPLRGPVTGRVGHVGHAPATIETFPATPPPRSVS